LDRQKLNNLFNGMVISFNNVWETTEDKPCVNRLKASLYFLMVFHFLLYVVLFTVGSILYTGCNIVVTITILSSPETLFHYAFREEEVDNDDFKLFGLHPAWWTSLFGLLEDVPQLIIQIIFASYSQQLTIIQIASFVFSGWHVTYIVGTRWYKCENVPLGILYEETDAFLSIASLITTSLISLVMSVVCFFSGLICRAKKKISGLICHRANVNYLNVGGSLNQVV
jgi:hypothetical protein